MPFSSKKLSVKKLIFIPIAFLIASCGFDSLVSSFKSNSKKYHVTLHDIGHIDFPGFLGRQIFGNDTVQLMVATATESGSQSCQIIHPDIKDESLQVANNLVDEKNRDGWSHAAWSPVISFWRVHSTKDRDYFRNSMPDIFGGLDITKEMMDPAPRHFSFMTKDHRDKVKLSFLELEGIPEGDLAVSLNAGSGILLNFLLQPRFVSGSCKVEMQYWCQPESADLCKAAPTYEQRKPFDPQKGIGIETGAVSKTLVKSAIKSSLEVDNFSVKPIDFYTSSIIPLNEFSNEVEAPNPEASLAKNLFDLEGEDIVQALSNTVSIHQLDLALSKQDVLSFMSQSTSFLGINQKAIFPFVLDSIERTGFENIRALGFKSAVNAANQEFSFESRVDVTLNQSHVLEQRDPRTLKKDNRLTVHSQFSILGFSKVSSYYRVNLLGADYLWGGDQEAHAVNEFTLHDEEGSVLRLDNGDVTTFDKDIFVEFYGDYDTEIEGFLQSMTLKKMPQYEIARSVFVMLQWLASTRPQNKIHFKISADEQSNNIFSKILATFLTAKPTYVAISDIGESIQEVIITPGKISIVLTQPVEGYLDSNRQRGRFGELITYNGKSAAVVEVELSSNRQVFDLRGLYVKKSGKLLPIRQLQYTIVDTNNQPYGKASFAIDIKDYKRQLLVSPSGDYIYKDVFIKK